MSETTDAKYAHEVVPHLGEGETAPLETLARYHYAQAEGWIKAFSDAIGVGDYGPAGADFTLASFMGHMHRALLFDALAQGLGGQAAADWANTRNHGESAEWIWERAAVYGLNLEATPIRAYRYKREAAEVVPMTAPDPQPPAAPEADVRLTEVEREALAKALWLIGGGDPKWGWDNLTDFNQNYHRDEVDTVAPIVERIVAERVRVVEGERDAAREALQRIHDDHQRQTETWNHRNFPTENASRWHDGFITACAKHAIEAKKGLDPEGAAEDDRVWKIGATGSDLDWYRETGHCGRCGDVATNCGCNGECGCFSEHGPRKEPYVSPIARAESAEAAHEALRAGVEALCDPANDGPRPYAVPIDGDVLLAVDVEHLRALLAGTR